MNKKPAKQKSITPRTKLALPEGELTIEVRSVETGKVVSTRKCKNLIVSNFRTVVMYALSGQDLDDRWIDRCYLGTNGVAPLVTDVGITNPVSVPLASAYPPYGKAVTFTGTMAADVGNGVAFQEAGLMFAGAGLAARRTFSVMTKSSAFTWGITWTIRWL